MNNTEKTNDVKRFGYAFIMLGNDRASQDQLIAAMVRVLTQGTQAIEKNPDCVGRGERREAPVYQYIALGVAIAEVLYVVTAIFRRECSVVFTTMLSMIILCLVYAHFHT